MNDRIKKDILEWVSLETMKSELRTGVHLGDSVSISLGRVLVGIGLRAGHAAIAVQSVSSENVRHICDWLTVAIQRGEHWLSRVDNQGRPLKLMKFGTVQQILDEADKAMGKRRGDTVNTDALKGTKVVHDAGDGWAIVRLTTPDALDYEGRIMGHCVGHGAYDYGLSTNFTGIYSLRDSAGNSHVTIEIDHSVDQVEQIKGKQNKPPRADYMRRLLGWRGLMDKVIPRSELPPGFGLMRNKGIVELSSMKAGDVFYGDIPIVLHADQDDYVLDIPVGVTVRGDVTVMGYKAVSRLAMGESGSPIPLRYPSVRVSDGVVIDGTLSLDHVTLDGFSAKASVLRVRNAEIRKLGTIDCIVTQFANVEFRGNSLDGVSFAGSMEAQACRGISFMPSTNVQATISIAGCQSSDASVSFLPGFSPKKLHIFNSHVSFPDEFHVRSHLKMERASIYSMPASLTVNGDFTVKACLINQWPETMVVSGDFTEDGVQLAADHLIQPLRPLAESRGMGSAS
jgi:hypothetical protein